MGNALRDRVAGATRGLSVLDRFVLFAAATLANDQSGLLSASVLTVADLCGCEASNVRKVFRRHEGRVAHVSGEGARLMGLDPGRFLYPLDREARQGDGAPCRYTLAVPAVPPAIKRRKARNPTGKTSHAASVGRFPKPRGGSVSQTHAAFSSGGGGSVSQTPPVGLGNPPTWVSQTDKLKELNELRGAMPPSSPPLGEEEEGREGPRPAATPSTTTPTPSEATLERWRALEEEARRQGDARRQEPMGETGEESDAV